MKVKDEQIKKNANKSRSISELMRLCGYADPGSDTKLRIERVLGSHVYLEIAQGKRRGKNALNKKEWTRI